MTATATTAPATESGRLAAHVARLRDLVASLGKPAVVNAIEAAGLGSNHASCVDADALENAQNTITGLQLDHDELQAIADMAHEGHDRFGRATCGQEICRRFREAIG